MFASRVSVALHLCLVMLSFIADIERRDASEGLRLPAIWADLSSDPTGRSSRRPRRTQMRSRLDDALDAAHRYHRVIRFRQEPCFRRQLAPADIRSPRRHHHTDVRACACHHLREIYAAQPARHIDISENRVDIATRAKNSNGFENRTSLDNCKSRLLQHVCQEETDEWFIFNDEDNSCWLVHLSSPWFSGK